MFHTLFDLKAPVETLLAKGKWLLFFRILSVFPYNNFFCLVYGLGPYVSGRIWPSL